MKGLDTMVFGEHSSQALEDFYYALSEVQKAKVEAKLTVMLREQISTLPSEKVNTIRYQIASDMFRVLKG